VVDRAAAVAAAAEEGADDMRTQEEGIMNKRHVAHQAVLILAVWIAVALTAMAQSAPSGKKYATANAAFDAFVNALRAHDAKTLTSIFGSGSDLLFQTDDPTADQNLRTEFLRLYDVRHEIQSGSDGLSVLVVGSGNWPFPIPVVKSGSKWVFDTSAGLNEIINRRIGRNELSAIQTCFAFADAEREYYLVDHDGDGILEYAQKFRSTLGLQDGLFWPTEENQTPSPLGLFVAKASEEGYTAGGNAYHGYHYKTFSSQGPDAPGGAYDYMAHGSQIGGFAIVAWPAKYGENGIMTFMLSHSGVIYQKDLGPNTDDEVLKLTSFNPDATWTKVPDKDTAPLPYSATQ
jgi:hypothetical protein